MCNSVKLIWLSMKAKWWHSFRRCWLFSNPQTMSKVHLDQPTGIITTIRWGKKQANPKTSVSSTAGCIGSCDHTSKECNRKAEGHKDDASFTNMLGGSSSGCYWLQEWQVGATDSIYKLNRNVSDLSVVAPPKQSSYAILDSGATGNFVATQDLSKLTLLPNNTSHSPIISASGNIIKPSARGQLQLSEKLSPTAQQALVPKISELALWYHSHSSAMMIALRYSQDTMSKSSRMTVW